MKRILLVLLVAVSTHANAVLVCGNDTFSEHGQWYVGQSADDTLGQIDTFGDVWCYATENELNYIKNNFAGLRMRNGRTNPSLLQWWQGDDAAFILNNL
jgi:hypothetical protein